MIAAVRLVHHQQALLAYARRLCRCSSEAQDLVQDTFLKAWLHCDAAPAVIEAERAWLYTILRNTFFTQVKRRRFVQIVPPNELPAPTVGCLGETVCDLSAVEAALATMPPGRARVFQLAHVHQLPYDEIVAREGIPLGTVKSRVSRVTAALAAMNGVPS